MSTGAEATGKFEYKIEDGIKLDTFKVYIISDAKTYISDLGFKVVAGEGDNQSPVAIAGNDMSIKVNESITIVGKGTDSDGVISSYEWKKGNESLIKDATLTYTPITIGTDILTLIVTDDGGKTASDSMTLTVTKADEANTDQADVDAVKNSLTFDKIKGSNSTQTEITSNLSLPTSENGVSIVWSSNNSNVISNTGSVSRGDSDQTVTLTAKLTKGDATGEFKITITVTKEEECTGKC